MESLLSPSERRRRDLHVITNPRLWPAYPFLPLIKRKENSQRYQCGVMFDCLRTMNISGYSATVFLTNLFTLPANRDKFFKLKKAVFDTPEELVEAGWTVD